MKDEQKDLIRENTKVRNQLQVMTSQYENIKTLYDKLLDEHLDLQMNNNLDRVSVFQKDINELTSIKNQLEDKLHELEEENKKLEELETLKNKVEEFESENLNLKEENKKLEELESLKSKIEEIENENANLKEENKKLEEFETLKNKLEEVEFENLSLKEDIEKKSNISNEELENLKLTIEEKDLKIKEIYETLNEEKAKLEKSLADFNVEKTSLEEKIQELETKLENQKNDFTLEKEESIKSLTEEKELEILEKIEEKEKQFAEEKQELSKKIEELEQKLNILEKDKLELEEKVSNFNSKSEEDKQLEKLEFESKLKAKDLELEALNNRVAELEKKDEQTSDYVNAMQEELSKALSIANMGIEKVGFKDNRIKELEKDKKTKEDMILELQKELEELKDRSRNVEEFDIPQLNDKTNKLMQDLYEKEMYIVAVEAKIREFEEEKNEKNQEIERKNQEIEALNKSLETKEKEFETTGNESDILTEKLENLEKDLAEKESIINENKDLNEKLSLELKELKEKLESLSKGEQVVEEKREEIEKEERVEREVSEITGEIPYELVGNTSIDDKVEKLDEIDSTEGYFEEIKYESKDDIEEEIIEEIAEEEAISEEKEMEEFQEIVKEEILENEVLNTEEVVETEIIENISLDNYDLDSGEKEENANEQLEEKQAVEEELAIDEEDLEWERKREQYKSQYAEIKDIDLEEEPKEEKAETVISSFEEEKDEEDLEWERKREQYKNQYIGQVEENIAKEEDSLEDNVLDSIDLNSDDFEEKPTTSYQEEERVDIANIFNSKENNKSKNKKSERKGLGKLFGGLFGGRTEEEIDDEQEEEEEEYSPSLSSSFSFDNEDFAMESVKMDGYLVDEVDYGKQLVEVEDIFSESKIEEFTGFLKYMLPKAINENNISGEKDVLFYSVSVVYRNYKNGDFWDLLFAELKIEEYDREKYKDYLEKELGKAINDNNFLSLEVNGQIDIGKTILMLAMVPVSKLNVYLRMVKDIYNFDLKKTLGKPLFVKLLEAKIQVEKGTAVHSLFNIFEKSNAVEVFYDYSFRILELVDAKISGKNINRSRFEKTLLEKADRII